MNIIQIIEQTINIKLLNYQKEFIKHLENNPDANIIFPRGKTTPYWLITYFIVKSFVNNEIIKGKV